MKKSYILTYKHISSTVSKTIYLKILLIKLYLKYIVRSRRFLKRLIKYSSSIIYTLIIMLLYITIIYFIGKHITLYNNIFDAIWETKGTIITSIVIVYVSHVIKEEKERKRNLENQFNFYSYYYYLADTLTESILKFVNLNYDDYYIFLYEDIYDNFFNYINNSEFNIDFNKTRLKQFTSSYEEILFDFQNNAYRLNSMELIACDLDFIYFKSLKKDLKDKLKKLTYDYSINNQKAIRQDIINISNQLYTLLSQLRRPWRWDLKYDNKIKQLLLKNNIENSEGNIIMKRIY